MKQRDQRTNNDHQDSEPLSVDQLEEICAGRHMASSGGGGGKRDGLLGPLLRAKMPFWTYF